MASESRNEFLPLAVRWTACLVLIVVSASLSVTAATNTEDLADLVDPGIGQYASGATVIGPTMPHCSIHPSPDTPKGRNDGYDPKQPIRGFSQFHPSGTGWGRYGNLFPNAGQDIYFLNGPLFDRAVLMRPDEGRLEITRAGKGDYVAAVTINGKSVDRSWVQHGELKGDTVLAFTMSEKPTAWGTQKPPPSDLSPCVETKLK